MDVSGSSKNKYSPINNVRVPPFIRNRCHAVLTAAWIHCFPFVQQISPAELAAEMVLKTMDEIGYNGDSKISVIDFCSGAGGQFLTAV
jgi:hypothetical protein